MENYSINQQFHRLLYQFKTEGKESSPRGLAVKELELVNIKINPEYPILDLYARPFNWKYFLGEMAWYLKKDRDIDFISNFSNFWGKLANAQNCVNSNYGNLLFGEQLHWALNSLLSDPDTRQAIAFVNNPQFQYAGNKDFVCTMYLNFWIRHNELHMKVQMRSNDCFFGTTYDVPFFSFVHQTMLLWLREKYSDLQLGSYYHCADNIHYYERHFEIAEQVQKENVKSPIAFLLNTPLFTLHKDEMILTKAGQDFIDSIDKLIEQNPKISQEQAKEFLSNYFNIY